MKSGVVEAIRQAGGEVYAITSEPQALATRAQGEWELNFECVGDPHQEVAETMRSRDWLDLSIAEITEFLTRDTGWEVKHPKGFFQPGVLALSCDQQLLYRWRSTPTRQNLGGAASRPKADYVWTKVQTALAENSGENEALDDTPELDGKPPPFAVFSAMLMANGWFLRPKAFAYRGDGNNPLRRFPKIILRLVLFLLAWVLAFVFLPTIWVGMVLALYLPIAVRGIRSVYSTFIHEPQ